MSMTQTRGLRMSRTRKTAALVLGGAMIVAAGSVMTAGPARAACTQWTLRGNFSIQQSNGLRVDVENWSGTTAGPQAQALLYLADGTVAQVNSDGQPVQHGNHKEISQFTSPTYPQNGTVSGGIQGNQMDFTVNWNYVKPPLSNHYTATIEDAGIGAKGETVNNRGTGDTWSTPQAFNCLT